MKVATVGLSVMILLSYLTIFFLQMYDWDVCWKKQRKREGV